jgi:acylphosphatase
VTNLISKKIIITGTVQGVGYRSWLQKICNDKGVVGWVANKKNGDVEAFFFKVGYEIFTNILSECFLGPKNSCVTNILVDDFEEEITSNNFEIRS